MRKPKSATGKEIIPSTTLTTTYFCTLRDLPNLLLYFLSCVLWSLILCGVVKPLLNYSENAHDVLLDSRFEIWLFRDFCMRPSDRATLGCRSECALARHIPMYAIFLSRRRPLSSCPSCHIKASTLQRKVSKVLSSSRCSSKTSGWTESERRMCLKC